LKNGNKRKERSETKPAHKKDVFLNAYFFPSSVVSKFAKQTSYCKLTVCKRYRAGWLVPAFVQIRMKLKSLKFGFKRVIDICVSDREPEIGNRKSGTGNRETKTKSRRWAEKRQMHELLDHTLRGAPHNAFTKISLVYQYPDQSIAIHKSQ